MKLAKALGSHVQPMMIVIPLGMLGIVPGLTLLFIAFSLVLIAGWLCDGLVMRSHPRHSTGVLGGGPTRW